MVLILPYRQFFASTWNSKN